MVSGLMNLLHACWRPFGANRHVHADSDALGRQDGLLWYKDCGQHLNGEFSMAVVQANSLLEDQSQLESGPLSLLENGPQGTLIGVYDGHGGPETSRFINENLFHHLKRFTTEQQMMSLDALRKAVQAIEDEFVSLVTKQWSIKPQIAAVGSCCLVSVICNGILYVANLGDSRAVLGRLVRSNGEVIAVQLSEEHNASIESVRQEMHLRHPDDPRILVLKHSVYEVKGIIQVTRSIGDEYLKKPEFNRKRRRLVKAALQGAAKKREMRYSDLKKIDRGVRRHFHDDITVIVVFLDSNLIRKASTNSIRGPILSVRGGGINLSPNSLVPCTTPLEINTPLCN